MTRTVTAGLDGSPESRAAVEWAAREAALRDLPLRILHVREPEAGTDIDRGAAEEWARTVRESAAGLRLRHPGIEVVTDQVTAEPAPALAEAADGAELLALGSRGLGRLGGFLVGSAGLYVIAHTTHPVVLVRAGETAADEHQPDPSGVPSAATPFRPVVLGLDIDDPEGPSQALLEFSFDAAARRGAALRVVHGWTPPPYAAYGIPADPPVMPSFGRRAATLLTEVLRPWRQKFPDVEVSEVSRAGNSAPVLIDAARDASLVVVGRRIRKSPYGIHIGHVTHAVLHHVAAPVAVVAHS
ncbi:universal stress protein [Streptomyces sp. NPDC046976]|uniref:universal stress protein n=1 Tax=Streptomyces sp. NPDC046976 TaxID=3155258 RepID=UPI003402159E